MCFGFLSKARESDYQDGGYEPKYTSSVPMQVPIQQQPVNSSGPHLATRQAIDVFLLSKLDNGEMGGIGYWQTANAYNAVVLHDWFSGERVIQSQIIPALDKVQQRVPHFINEFNDDTLWWAHCLLALHPLVIGTPRERWLFDHLVAIWRHVAKFQLPMGRHFVDGNHDMGGAVMWTSKDGEEQVNSITTGLFASLSARLALILCPATPSDPDRRAAHPYLGAAELAVAWIFRECYREHERIVLDGIKIRCGERVDWTFTYTTAAAISALVYLAIARRSVPSWHKQREAYGSFGQACDLAQAAMCRDQWVDPESGILTEKGAYGQGTHDPWQNNDAVGFKSVLVRSLCDVLLALRNPDPLVQDLVHQQMRLSGQIEDFIKTQYRALQERNTNGQGQYGPWWDGPFEAPTGWSQMAVLDVMAAIHLASFPST